MLLSATTVVYPQGELPAAVRDVASAGLDGIELQGHHALWLLADEAREDAFRSLLARSGLRVSAVMLGYLDSEEALQQLSRVVDLAARLGAGTVPVLPPRNGTADDAAFIELLGRLAHHAEGAGVRIAVHHHLGTLVSDAEDIDRLLDATLGLPGVGLLLDTAHLALHGPGLEEHLRRWSGRILHAHLKDLVADHGVNVERAGPRDAQQHFRTPGEGALELGSVVRTLAIEEARPWLSLEIETFHRPPLDSLLIGKATIEGALQ